MKVGDKIVCCYNGKVTVAVIGSKSNHWLYDVNGKAICMEVIAELDGPVTRMAAMQEFEQEYQRLKEKYEQQFVADFPGEHQHNGRLEGVNAQLEVTNREYRAVQIHAA